MATLKILRCRECQRPLPEGKLECPKCHTVHKIQEEATINPLRLNKEMANDYIDFFKNQTESNPKDTNALFGMGLVYMGLKNYELAQRNFQMAVDLSPLEPDVYYYFALSLFEGHNPKHIEPKVSDRIEEWLHTASNRQEKRKYLVLLMVLRQCAFVSNGLQFKGESPLELMEKIRKIMPEQDDVAEIREHVKITDPQANEWLNEIQSGEMKKEDESVRESRYYSGQYTYKGPWPTNRQKNDADFSFPDDPGKSISRLADEQVRRDFFDYMYEPDKPVRLIKPGYPIGHLIKHLILAPIGMVIMLIIISIAELGLKEIKNEPVKPVRQEYNEWAKRQKQKPNATQRKDKMAELRNDSIERAREDSTFFADVRIFYYQIENAEGEKENLYFKEPTEEQMKNVVGYGGYEKSWKSILAVFLFLFPLIYGLLSVIIRFSRVSRERRSISNENERRRRNYEHAMHMFNEGRPSICDYVGFCKHYLTKESPFLEQTGDPVSKALRDNHIDELDMKGKILFLNYFDDKDDNNNPTDAPHHVLSRIYYVIAIPQTDKLTLLYNYWDTVSNEITSCDAENIYYKKILGVSKRTDGILIEKEGGTITSIAFPPRGEVSICTYQNDFPEYITFSNTRTSDPQVFLDALNALVASYR